MLTSSVTPQESGAEHTVRRPVAEALAHRLSAISFSKLSPRALQMSVTEIIDTVGVTLAGAAEPAVRILTKTLDQTSPNRPVTLFGQYNRASVLDAAMINGTASHAIDYDDMAAAMGGHLSVPVVPVVFALGEALHVVGPQLIEAYVVGFEAECRLGRTVHPHHYESGWHPTSILGVFGAAAAAARLLCLDQSKVATALCIAALIASGIKANFGTMSKPLHVGQACRNGMLAAQLAQAGFTADPAALESKEGSMRHMTDWPTFTWRKLSKRTRCWRLSTTMSA